MGRESMTEQKQTKHGEPGARPSPLRTGSALTGTVWPLPGNNRPSCCYYGIVAGASASAFHSNLDVLSGPRRVAPRFVRVGPSTNATIVTHVALF